MVLEVFLIGSPSPEGLIVAQNPPPDPDLTTSAAVVAAEVFDNLPFT